MKLDKKHIHTVRSLDDRFYHEGFAYKVFFKNHPKARAMGDGGRGVICLCTSASGGCVEFAHVVHGFDGIKVESVSLMVKTIEKYDIDIYMCYPELVLRETIDNVKRNPQKFHGLSEYNDTDDTPYQTDHILLTYVYGHYQIAGFPPEPLIIDVAGDMCPDIDYAFNISKLYEMTNKVIKIDAVSKDDGKIYKVELEIDKERTDEHTLVFRNIINPKYEVIYTLQELLTNFKSFTISKMNINGEESHELKETI